MTHQSLESVDFSLAEIPVMERPGCVLLTEPTFFEIKYVINPHMAGNIGTVDKLKAVVQWEALLEAYKNTGITTRTIGGAPGQPDMVFCANQTLPFVSPEGKKSVYLSRMFAPERQGEVDFYRSFFEQEGYSILTLPQGKLSFEGMGDAIWHPGHRLLWGGFGFRTDMEVYNEISSTTGAPVILLELNDPEFYHLDTCLSLLDEKSAIVFPEAFQPQGLEMIRGLIPNLIEAPEYESRHLFAVNAHSPDGKHVLIQKGCENTCEQLVSAGFLPVELDTSEFLKSGGSVFCMKMMYW